MKLQVPDINQVVAIRNDDEFEQICLNIFRFQYGNNDIYRRFCLALGVDSSRVERTDQIPFLPIEAFKTHKVLSTTVVPEFAFESSGTGLSAVSRHYITDPLIYHTSLTESFKLQYGSPENYCILALLPSYLERGNSSLVYMVLQLIGSGAHALSGFFLYDFEKLAKIIAHLIALHQPTILLGVSYALLDFSEKYPIKLPGFFTIMETGGMKGRRNEMVREELHGILKQRFDLPAIHSEYGMTELLSQAYSKGDGLFVAPPWMRVMMADLNDPMHWIAQGNTGAIHIIDLANINSCAFIATQDIGRCHAGGKFEVLGRYDHSDIRGCNLMAV